MVFCCDVAESHAGSSREVVDVAHRLPMFTPVACGNTTVEFLPGMVCKTMSGFAQSLPHQTLEVVQQAYALGTADSQHYLVGCKAPARLARTKYRVDVTPVGFPHLPRTEQVPVHATSVDRTFWPSCASVNCLSPCASLTACMSIASTGAVCRTMMLKCL